MLSQSQAVNYSKLILWAILLSHMKIVPVDDEKNTILISPSINLLLTEREGYTGEY